MGGSKKNFAPTGKHNVCGGQKAYYNYMNDVKAHKYFYRFLCSVRDDFSQTGVC